MSDLELNSIVDRVVQVSRTFDPSTRLPVVVIDSSALPEHNSDLYTSIVEKTIGKLPKADYVMLFLACGAPSKPSWSWVARTYSMLERDTKKRVKKIYVVHESWWVRAVTEMLRGVVSSKFRRKIVHVSSLSQLAQHLDITLVNIPPKVYQHNLKIEDKITIPRHHTPVFGRTIQDNGHLTVPPLWTDCLRYLAITGPNTKGVFNKLEDLQLLYILRDCFDRGQLLDLNDYGPVVTASLVKMYMHELPTPVIPLTVIQLPLQDTKEYAVHTLRRLDYSSKVILFSLLDVLHTIVNNRQRTFHTSGSLAAVLAPSLMGHNNMSRDNTAIVTRFFRNVIDYWKCISEDIDQKQMSGLALPEPSNVGSMAPPPIPFAHHRNVSSPEISHVFPSEKDLAAFNHRSVSEGLAKSRSQTSSPVKGAIRTSNMGPPPPPPIPRTKRSTPNLQIKVGGDREINTSGILQPSNRPNIGLFKLPTKKVPLPVSPTSPRKSSSSSGAGIPAKTPTRRGKVVAELAAFYEDKGTTAQILIDLERDRKKWSVSKGIADEEGITS